MLKLRHICAFVALALVLPVTSAEPARQPELAELKNKVDVAGIRIGMSLDEARRAIESIEPKLVVKPLHSKGPQRRDGWLAKRDTPACKGEALGCEEIMRVEAVDGRVFMIAHSRSFAPGEPAPTAAAAQAALSQKYGALVTSTWSTRPTENIIEHGFETDGTQRHEACVAISEKGRYGQWIYGFNSQCDWVFNTELVRDKNGAVRGVDVLLGDAHAAYQALGGIEGKHKRALAAVVGRQRDREVVVASRPN